MRKSLKDITIEECGFQVIPHHSEALALNTREEIETYRRETEDLLREEFGAVYVKCYEVRKRENVAIQRSQMDYNDPLLVEGPAKGAHNGMLIIRGNKMASCSLGSNGRCHLLVWSGYYQQKSFR
jgi:hypothetical protein